MINVVIDFIISGDKLHVFKKKTDVTSQRSSSTAVPTKANDSPGTSNVVKTGSKRPRTDDEVVVTKQIKAVPVQKIRHSQRIKQLLELLEENEIDDNAVLEVHLKADHLIILQQLCSIGSDLMGQLMKHKDSYMTKLSTCFPEYRSLQARASSLEKCRHDHDVLNVPGAKLVPEKPWVAIQPKPASPIIISDPEPESKSADTSQSEQPATSAESQRYTIPKQQPDKRKQTQSKSPLDGLVTQEKLSYGKKKFFKKKKPNNSTGNSKKNGSKGHLHAKGKPKGSKPNQTKNGNGSKQKKQSDKDKAQQRRILELELKLAQLGE